MKNLQKSIVCIAVLAAATSALSVPLRTPNVMIAVSDEDTMLPMAPNKKVAAPVNQVAPKPVVVQPVAPAATPPGRVFELRRSDGNVKTAFLRWAEAADKQVNWQLQSELPLDATARIEASTLAEAMTEVAKAFTTHAKPFVIREYDNTILVLPRLVARP
ncbi:hypothetical protein Rfer_4250 (plasmid) [Rhodoferax ferrireducens T118]|uniref:Toxin co-regulated pilus biosynthesis protein Q C-terminal domain-containing protein n=1 Tax=Albidiferax ferrireducens (strain ATCC BAA-621 / DSM 15236 / T118) TaxID=338969 RepID=Q21QK8_ALBFT|nr:TcpQ domain-containing protein [Rhodoferax ferrireducens]ABD71937.1 hypothetical protein Rfer_4250 [Rhodoferax ferrireducens T118]